MFLHMRNALLLGAALLTASAMGAAPASAAAAAKAKPPAATGKKPPVQPVAKKKSTSKAKAGAKAAQSAKAQKPGPLADFGKESAPEEVAQVAHWVSYTRDNKNKAFVLIDKKAARMWVFDRQGKLKSHTPVLLGKAVGDHTVPGIGNKPMSQIKEHEKTTPAGRFRAEPGRNTRGEDIIWIDYNASVSMHRLRKVSAKEERAQRMATEDPSDNRISFGCVNVPPKFYDGVLKPNVMKYGAFVYVLPETKTPQQLFGSLDVPRAVDKPVQLAQAQAGVSTRPLRAHRRDAPASRRHGG